MRRIFAALAGLVMSAVPAGAQTACRQALVLGLDVSGSVDAREYRLQIAGLADALNDARVRQSLLALPDAPVMLMIFEWSGPVDQAVLVPWTQVQNTAGIDAIVQSLRQTQRREATPGTALGVAMELGAGFLAQQPACWKRTLDISGDGKSNFGPRPRDVKDAIAAGITINGLVIGADNPASGDIRQAEIAELSAYFRAEVILGPDGFVQTALGFEDYKRAMTEKLLRELDGLVLSQVPDQ